MKRIIPITLTLFALFPICVSGQHWKSTSQTNSVAPTDSSSRIFWISLAFDRSLDPRNYTINRLEGRFTLTNFSVSFRLNKLLSQGLRENKKIETFDVQFIGFESNPDGIFSFNTSVGFYVEQANGWLYPEIVGGLRYRSNHRWSLYSQGRFTTTGSTSGRTEFNAGLEHLLLNKPNYNIHIRAFGNTALYRYINKNVPVDGFGFGLHARF